jgi:hypothetical protein
MRNTVLTLEIFACRDTHMQRLRHTHHWIVVAPLWCDPTEFWPPMPPRHPPQKRRSMEWQCSTGCRPWCFCQRMRHLPNLSKMLNFQYFLFRSPNPKDGRARLPLQRILRASGAKPRVYVISPAIAMYSLGMDCEAPMNSLVAAHVPFCGRAVVFHYQLKELEVIADTLAVARMLTSHETTDSKAPTVAMAAAGNSTLDDNSPTANKNEFL